MDGLRDEFELAVLSPLCASSNTSTFSLIDMCFLPAKFIFMDTPGRQHDRYVDCSWWCDPAQVSPEPIFLSWFRRRLAVEGVLDLQIGPLLRNELLKFEYRPIQVTIYLRSSAKWCISISGSNQYKKSIDMQIWWGVALNFPRSRNLALLLRLVRGRVCCKWWEIKSFSKNTYSPEISRAIE